jgi:hypothetical protein
MRGISIGTCGAIAGCLAGAVLLSGCATPVTVMSDPPGAAVYARGSGRAAYRWQYRGTAPVTFPAYYNAVLAFVRWPDGTRSDIRRGDCLLVDSVEMRFQAPPPAVTNATQRREP